MKDFLEQLNDIAAPVSRAYTEPEIQSVIIDSEDFANNGTEATMTLRVKFKRTAIFLAVVDGAPNALFGHSEDK